MVKQTTIDTIINEKDKKLTEKKHYNNERAVKHIDNIWNLDLLPLMKYYGIRKNKLIGFFVILDFSRKYGVTSPLKTLYAQTKDDYFFLSRVHPRGN